MKNDPQSSEALMRRAEMIFCEALAVESEEERTAFVEISCEDDPALLEAVEELLALEEDADDFFKEESLVGMSAVDIAKTLPEFSGDDDSGKQIGPYTLLKKIGEGGVGNVYLAEQSTPVRRQVALKIIKAGMDTKSVIARFEAERQALALMEHPNIAHVLHAGETDTGRPFFVMELVHGVRITTFCNEAGLDVRRRLELFVQVCHAIQHAHQKGVVHRDIKPSNVLVSMHDGVPMPVVIDFGIAKATGENLLSDQTFFTAREMVIGTPAYMSPEQAQMGDVDVDTRSDIYSLGALLYELLVGRPPFDQKELLRSGLETMRQTLRDVDPLLPSVRLRKMGPEDQQSTVNHLNTDVRRLNGVLAGDLDWVVMKALEKDRARRYESADALAADLERYLNSEPVLARSPSRAYRLRKLARRNRAACAYLTALFFALAGGLGVSSRLLVKERQARERAVRAEQEQSLLRQAAEDRERIAYAAALIAQGKLEEADRLAAEVSTELMPSLEVGSVLRTLGEWNAKQERWEPAVKLFTSLLQADVMDDSDAVSIDLLLAGPVLITTGDLSGYEAFRRAVVERHQGSDDLYMVERTLKICLLLPAEDALMNQLEAFREVTVAETPVRPTDHLEAWRCMTLGLVAYRQEKFQDAVVWSERCRTFNADATSRTAASHIIQAMAHARLDENNPAAEQLATGRRMVIDWFAVAPEKRTDRTGYWFDWLFARILLREAEMLMP